MVKRFLVLAGALSASMILSGCAGSAATPQDGRAPAEPTQMEPQRGGIFHNIGLRDLPHLHPWTNPRNNISHFLVTSVYQTLVNYQAEPFKDFREEYKLKGLLAERWELKDNTVYTFHLRRNVKWHDGKPFTAHDVKYSYDTLGDPGSRYIGGASLRTVSSITALDDHTIQMVTREPDVELLDKLSQTPASIMPKHAHERGEDFEKVAIGTGPFKVELNQRGQGTIYAANRDYWVPGQPYLDKYKMLPSVDEGGRIAAFIAGQADVVKVPNRIQAETVLAQARHAKHAPFLRDNTSELFLKLDRPPFNDARVREALHLMVDRQAMVDTLTQGDGLMNPPAINPVRKAWAVPQDELRALPGWRTSKDQDVARARQLLAEAGYSSGLGFTIRVDRSHPDRPALSEMVGEQLRQLGINVQLQPMESASLQKAWVDGDYESVMYTGNAPDNWRQQLHSSAPLNRMPVVDPELDRLIDAQAQEFDENKRRQHILEMQRLLIRQNYVIPTITLVGYVVWQPFVQGWIDNQSANTGNMDWASIWLDPATAPKDRQ